MSNEARWMKLDNAAKIYPAVMSRKWTALFRLSATFTDPIDPEILQKAVDRTLTRFPAFAQRLKRGLFWFYFERVDTALVVQRDVGNPCARMNLRENHGYMLRVRYYENRIAVEFFHALTDGTGGLSFLKTLSAEYVELRYGEKVPREGDILNCNEAPKPNENEDGFLKYARGMTRSRSESSAYLISGTEEEHFMHIVTGIVDTNAMLGLAKAYKATLTEFMAAVLIGAVDTIQLRHRPQRRKHRPVKICIPVNLRKFYGSNTVRNFASYVNVGIEPKYGDFTLDETVRAVRGQMAAEVSEKLLNAKFSTNVRSEQNKILRVMPLYIKSQAMKLAFSFKGDRQSSSSISNLGNVELPGELARRITRLDFMLGPLKRNRVAVGVLSYGGKLIISFTRKIIEPHVERGFFTQLRKMGLHVLVESNARQA